ncbi:hypothetical protein [Candidatus Halocynthiibacter alkanivorans]|uniref:hypothetical protein n=1 Tax=Candidatus Halocynthiibacter alkanivorans TaxID=2267619 RepID=UPI000DF30B63|nr:hypothetical protein [Candidatus Halocynthiibacter alkanivorans]
MNEKLERIVEYHKLTKIRLKTGFIFTFTRDPSEDLEIEIRSFLNNNRADFNRKVANAFDLPEGGYTKFEFFWVPQRARRISSDDDRIGNNKIIFRSAAEVTLIYLKERSLIIFNTEYSFAVTDAGCGGKGEMHYSGGRNYTLEEIYFNKISTVGAYHDEEMYNVLKPGCGGGTTTKFTIEKDGFVIRAGENFRVLASERHRSEMKDARQMINDKISSSN